MITKLRLLLAIMLLGHMTCSYGVIKGVEVPYYPNVYKIGPHYVGHCTISFITKNIAITAAHCINYKRQDLISLRSSGKFKGLRSSKVFVHPKVKIGSVGVHITHEQKIHDLALIEFPEVESEDVFELISPDEDLMEDDPVKFIGFGYSDEQSKNGIGIKRRGTSHIKEFPSGLIRIVGANTPNSSSYNSGVAFGDSGGPLLTFNNKLIGIVSSAGEIDDGIQRADFVDLRSEKSILFFSSAIKNKNLDLPHFNCRCRGSIYKKKFYFLSTRIDDISGVNIPLPSQVRDCSYLEGKKIDRDYDLHEGEEEFSFLSINSCQDTGQNQR